MAANRETVAASVELGFRATLEMKVCSKKALEDDGARLGNAKSCDGGAEKVQP